MKTLYIFCLCSFGVLFSTGSPTVGTPDFVLTIAIEEPLGHITFYASDGSKKDHYYTRDGEFHIDAAGFIAAEVNGETVGEGESALVTLPSGTDITVDFPVSGEVYCYLP